MTKLAPHGGCWWEGCKICNPPGSQYPLSWRNGQIKEAIVTEEITAVSDSCDECGDTVWYDPNDPAGAYCEDEDLAVEHECDPDEYEEDEE